MMVENNYEINVAREVYEGKGNLYSHYCKIELGYMFEEKARVKFNDIKKRFPAPEFQLELRYVNCYGKVIDRS